MPANANLTALVLAVAIAATAQGEPMPECQSDRDWADAVLSFPYKSEPSVARYPFSFTYGGRSSDVLLPTWKHSVEVTRRDAAVRRVQHTWRDRDTKLSVTVTATRHTEFHSVEWLLTFENRGTANSSLIEDVQSLDLKLWSPETPFMLHRTKGAPSDPSDFEPTTVPVTRESAQVMAAAGGRSSNGDLPFFMIESGKVATVFAVGWSGQWSARVEQMGATQITVKAGLQRTRFVLYPGESVRSPLILAMRHTGETPEANTRFRQLILTQYAARKGGRLPRPTLFCNTCFTRGGGWLNECNAENQISLIRAYGPLGLDALITDAGWFEGGWPAGAGNWMPRKDAYPDGMAPVAAAAKASGMTYGLWFEPERVVPDTALHRERPDWLLSDGSGRAFLLDMGNPAAREYFLNIVRGFMKLPGFSFYRQDFNIDPLPFWTHSDAPDRQGVTEMKYIEGLYAYWDAISREFPDSFREECASGGRRIDLETVRRMPIHQMSDYWFDDEVDQSRIWSLSRYLPNSVFTTPLSRLDDYSFHSTLATSLCLGWIADAPGFDIDRAKKLTDAYRRIQHLLNGSFYPLTPYSRSNRDWLAYQFHRADMGEGMALIFRRANSPESTATLQFHGLTPETTYRLTFNSTGQTREIAGRELLQGIDIELSIPRSSERIEYRAK